MKTVFLVGPIGAGKSTALAYFQRRGATVLSADDVVHDLYSNDKHLIADIERVCPGVIDSFGELDRKVLASHLLEQPESVMLLEGIVHPKVREKLSQVIESASSDVFVYELPISRPVTDFTLANAVIVIDASRDKRLERVMKRGLTKEEASRRLEFHPYPFVPDHLPVFHVDNSGNEEALYPQLEHVMKVIQNG